jgi:outer membrane protein OmpA-like peptidoglycan-associated protein
MKRLLVLALLAIAGVSGSVEAQPTAVLPPSAEAAAIGGALSQSYSQAQRQSVSPETVRPPSAAFLIEFEFDSARLTTDGAVFLGRIVEIILSSPELANARFLVDGHTDAIGSRSYNQSLGQARASTIYAALAQQGIPAWRLFSRSFGEDWPLPGLDPYDGRNRRVEITPF